MQVKGIKLIKNLVKTLEIFLTLVKSRVLIDYTFDKDINDLLTFEKIWCCNGALCMISENDLIFTLKNIWMCSCIFV